MKQQQGRAKWAMTPRLILCGFLLIGLASAQAGIKGGGFAVAPAPAPQGGPDAAANALKNKSKGLSTTKDPAKQKIWEEARNAADGKINELDRALKSGNPDRIKKASVDLQADPLAVQRLNNGTNKSLIEQQNHVTGEIQEAATQQIKEKVARQWNDAHPNAPKKMTREDVQLKPRTNYQDPTAPETAAQDWDANVQVKNPKTGKMEDVPRAKAQDIVEKAYYDAAGAEKTFGEKSTPKSAAKRQSVEITDAAHPESYKDPDTVLGKGGKKPEYDKPVEDPTGLTKTMDYKSDKAAQEAAKLRQEAKALRSKGDEAGARAKEIQAQGKDLEQIRNSVKQFNKINKPRVEAAGGEVHPTVEKGMKILEEAGKGNISPEEARAELAKIGETPETIMSKANSQSEVAQKFGKKGTGGETPTGKTVEGKGKGGETPTGKPTEGKGPKGETPTGKPTEGKGKGGETPTGKSTTGGGEGPGVRPPEAPGGGGKGPGESTVSVGNGPDTLPPDTPGSGKTPKPEVPSTKPGTTPSEPKVAKVKVKKPGAKNVTDGPEGPRETVEPPVEGPGTKGTGPKAEAPGPVDTTEVPGTTKPGETTPGAKVEAPATPKGEGPKSAVTESPSGVSETPAGGKGTGETTPGAKGESPSAPVESPKSTVAERPSGAPEAPAGGKGTGSKSPASETPRTEAPPEKMAAGKGAPKDTPLGKAGRAVKEGAGKAMESAFIIGTAHEIVEGIKNEDPVQVAKALVGQDSGNRAEMPGVQDVAGSEGQRDKSTGDYVHNSLYQKLVRMGADKDEAKRAMEKYDKGDRRQFNNLTADLKSKGAKDSKPVGKTGLTVDKPTEMNWLGDEGDSIGGRLMEGLDQAGKYGETAINIVTFGLPVFKSTGPKVMNEEDMSKFIQGKGGKDPKPTEKTGMSANVPDEVGPNGKVYGKEKKENSEDGFLNGLRSTFFDTPKAFINGIYDGITAADQNDINNQNESASKAEFQKNGQKIIAELIARGADPTEARNAVNSSENNLKPVSDLLKTLNAKNQLKDNEPAAGNPNSDAFNASDLVNVLQWLGKTISDKSSENIKASDGFNQGLQQVASASTSGDQQIMAAGKARDQAGAEAQDTMSQSSAKTAADQNKNSWNNVLGDALAQGLAAGGSAFGSAVGAQAAAKAGDSLFGPGPASPGTGPTGPEGGGGQITGVQGSPGGKAGTSVKGSSGSKGGKGGKGGKATKSKTGSKGESAPGDDAPPATDSGSPATKGNYDSYIKTYGKPAGYMSDGRPYWGKGTKEDPFTNHDIPRPIIGTVIKDPGAFGLVPVGSGQTPTPSGPVPKPTGGVHRCPICGKAMKTDGDGYYWCDDSSHVSGVPGGTSGGPDQRPAVSTPTKPPPTVTAAPKDHPKGWKCTSCGSYDTVYMGVGNFGPYWHCNGCNNSVH
ncbi:MAG: hypothetical protein NTV49_03550 [Kiritimatiellaeota bacterium]|nr:hypothetical protein [Kiritimatiellota bacterium]